MADGGPRLREIPERTAVRFSDDPGMSTHIGARHRRAEIDPTELAVQILEAVQSPVVVWDAAGYPVLFNNACLGIFDYSADDFAHLNRSELIHPDERAEVAAVAATRQTGDSGRRSYRRRLITRDMEVLELDCSSVGFPLQDGSMGILVEYRDVTAQLAAEGELKRHEQLYRGFVENATGIIFTTGADNRFITANHTWLELLGVSIQELRDRTLSELVHPEQQARTLETREERNAGRNVNSFVLPVQTADGGCRWLDLDLHSVLDDERRLLGMQGFGHDVTDEHEERERLLEEASTDGLTGIANRRHFDEFLSQQVASADRYGTPLSLVTLDLDHFKRLNDRYGHPAGDEVLRAVAAVLREVARESDLVARHGGEEFALVLPQTNEAGALMAAERCAEAIRSAEIHHDGQTLRVTASFGVVTFDQIAHRDADGLLEAADKAVYAAKGAGRNAVRIAKRFAA